MTDIEKNKCNAIIHGTSTLAMGVGGGLAQLPLSDNAVIIPLQVGMIVSLGAVFSMELTESAARATLATATATTVGRGLSEVLCGWIPVFGNIINACTAAVVTETIGWAVANSFDKKAQNRDAKLFKTKGAIKNE